MSGIKRQEAADFGAASEPFDKLVRKLVLVAADEGEILSHGRTLIRVAAHVAREVVVITRAGDRRAEVEALGVRVVPAGDEPPARGLARLSLAAWKLARMLEDENPGAVHLLGLQPAVLGSMALMLVPDRPVVMHMPDLGLLPGDDGTRGRLRRRLALRFVGALARRPASFLLVESDGDLDDLRQAGVTPGPRFAVLGGAGIDPDAFPVLPAAQGAMPVAAYVGDLTAGAGADLLVRAFERLWDKGVALQLELSGTHGEGRRVGTIEADVARWALHPGIRISAPPADVRELWRRAGIFVLPAASTHALPRALLEAAACGRPSIVAGSPATHGFVRDGVEGFLVPPGNMPALADALERLARDAGLRARMGEAARLRVLQGFTEAQVAETLRNVYLSLLKPAPSR